MLNCCLPDFSLIPLEELASHSMTFLRGLEEADRDTFPGRALHFTNE